MHLINQDLRPSDRNPVQPSVLMTASPVRPKCRWFLPVKFLAEWVMAAMLLVPLGIVIGFFAILVKLTSPGPMFYRQKRVGLRGRIFTMIKIRTMVEDSEAKTGPVWCKPGDPRITSIGKILRDTHIDELPQLWNVLRGEMSLIGPRPERPEMVAKLELTIPNYRDRIAVRPGLTGLAQVQLPPDSNEDSVKRKLAYDRYYVERVSLWLDARVAMSTVMYFCSAAADALCHGLVRQYGQDIERTFAKSDLIERSQSPQTA